MAQTKHEIQALLAGAGTEPRQRFGQNFMIDQNLVRLVADAGEISAGDVVIEVGPGTGTLTEELLSRGAARVVAVEIDRDLAQLLREKFAAEQRFALIEGDALAGKHELNEELRAVISRERSGKSVKLVANLPYNIASPLVIEMLIAGVGLLAFVVQKEVADRLRAKEGGGIGWPRGRGRFPGSCSRFCRRGARRCARRWNAQAFTTSTPCSPSCNSIRGGGRRNWRRRCSGRCSNRRQPLADSAFAGGAIWRQTAGIIIEATSRMSVIPISRWAE